MLEIKPTKKVLEKIVQDQVLAVSSRDKYHPRETGIHDVTTQQRKPQSAAQEWSFDSKTQKIRNRAYPEKVLT